jgi:hypothetical protein
VIAPDYIAISILITSMSALAWKHAPRKSGVERADDKPKD